MQDPGIARYLGVINQMSGLRRPITVSPPRDVGRLRPASVVAVLTLDDRGVPALELAAPTVALLQA
jgi:hypothetical protein